LYFVQVTSINDKGGPSCKLLSSQREELHLPDDMPLASAFVTEYYYPDGRDYPGKCEKELFKEVFYHVKTKDVASFVIIVTLLQDVEKFPFL